MRIPDRGRGRSGALRWYPVFLLLCVLLLVVASTGRAQVAPSTIYVAKTGSDNTGNGSFANPYGTISHAIIMAPAAGDTIVVMPGRYEDDDILRISFDKMLNLRSYGGPEVTTIVGSIIILDTLSHTRTLLKGFTILYGKPGIRIESADPEIAECIVDSCDSGNMYSGGGIYLYRSYSLIRDCTVRNCTAYYDGGGVFAYRSSPEITNCRIIGNSCNYAGGGVCMADPIIDGPTCFISNCVIRGNVAMYGGGVAGTWGGYYLLDSPTGGGTAANQGYYPLDNGNFYLLNNLIAGNTAIEQNGAGIYIDYDFSCIAYNNIIVYNNGSGANCVATGNGFFDYNCVFGNTTGQIEFCGDGGHNIFVDPMLVDYAGGDYHLKRTSPLINAGYDPGNLPEFDFDGQKRVVEGIVDIGPDEFADCELAASFSVDVVSGCHPLSVVFYGFVEGRYDSLFWDFGDGFSISNQLHTSHRYMTVGTYTVKFYAMTPCTTVMAVWEDSIRVLGSPTAGFTADVTQGCAPLAVDFTDGSVGGVSEWLWNFGDGGTSTLASPSHEYTAEGVYTVTLSVANACGMDQFQRTQYITVAGEARPDFGAVPRFGSAPLTVSFSDSSANAPFEWSWDFGDGSGSSERNPTHQYTEPGLFTVSMASVNECGTGTLERADYIRVYGFEVTVDADSSPDRFIRPFNVTVDTLYGGFDRGISLRALLHGRPRRGNAAFVFSDSTVNAPGYSLMQVRLTEDLAKGVYSGAVRSTAAGGSPVEVDTFYFESNPDPILSVSVDTLMFDSTQIGNTSAIPFRVRNLTTLPGTLFYLKVDSIALQGDGGFGATPVSFTVNPNSFVEVVASFTPADVGEFRSTLTIYSDDPVMPQYQVHLFGIGIRERVPPRVVATVPGEWESDVLITTPHVDLRLSEPVFMAQLAETLTVVSSKTGSPVVGEVSWVADSLVVRFSPHTLFKPLDTLTVTMNGDAVDSAGNTLDGDGDGVGEGSPQDDFRFSFVTGPGVFPGDANNDGIVNEVDVLPLAVYWRIQGPRRPVDNPADRQVQPAYRWEELRATYADCNGDGEINELDLRVIERNWGLQHSASGPLLIFADSHLEKFKDAFEAICHHLSDSVDSEISLRILDLIAKYVEIEAHSDVFSLSQNYPNPFNPATYIQYNLPVDCHVTLTVHNILGQTVATLLDEYQDAGFNRVSWDGRTEAGERLPSGIYFYRLTAGSFSQVKKMMMLR